MHIKKTVAENLPLGWIKEIRTKKTKGKIRSDPYYIDPVSGRQFRSMQEVFRYLKCNDSGEAESKPDDKGHTSMELVDNFQSLSAEAKEQMLIDKRKDKNVADRKGISDAAAPKNIEKPLVGGRRAEEASVVDKRQNKLPQTNAEERGRRKSMRLANKKPKDDAKEYLLQSGSETAAENMNIPESKGIEHKEKYISCTVETVQHENPTPQHERKSTKRKWMNNTPRRTSKGLASLEVNPPVEVKNSCKDGASAKLLSDTFREANELEAAKSCTFREANEPEAVKSCTMASDKIPSPTIDKTDEKSSSEEQKSIDVVSQKDQEHLDSTLKEIFMDPCIEFAFKMLTGAISFEDGMKSDSNPVSSSNRTSSCSSLSPCNDIWSDPCFEFAVKTLTGEMPTEDSLQVDKPGGSISLSNDTKSAATTNKVYPPSARR